jgi:hypothetical protein
VATPDGRFCIHELRRRPRWTTRHPASNRKQADCRPLLQHSPPNRGGSSGVTRGSSSLSSLSSSSTWASCRSALHSHRFRCPREPKPPHPGSLGPRRQGQQLHCSAKNWQFSCQTKGRLPKPPGCSSGGFLMVFAQAERAIGASFGQGLCWWPPPLAINFDAPGSTGRINQQVL